MRPILLGLALVFILVGVALLFGLVAQAVDVLELP